MLGCDLKLVSIELIGNPQYPLDKPPLVEDGMVIMSLRARRHGRVPRRLRLVLELFTGKSRQLITLPPPLS